MAELIPSVAFSIFAGKTIDRYGALKVLLFSQVLSVAQVSIFLLAALTHTQTASILLLLNVLTGFCNAYYIPSRISYLAVLAGSGSSKKAFALVNLCGNIAFLTGPGLFSIFFNSIGVSGIIIANLLSYIPLIAFLIADLNKKVPAPSIAKKNLVRFGDGLRYVATSRVISSSFAIFLIILIFGRGLVELSPAVAAQLVGGASSLSGLNFAFGAGAIAGGILAGTLNVHLRDHGIFIASFATAPAVVIYAGFGSLVLGLMGSFALGFLLALLNILVTSAAQDAADPQFRGQVSSIFSIIFKGGPVVGAFCYGIIAPHLGLNRAVFCGSIATLLLISLLLFLTRARKP